MATQLDQLTPYLASVARETGKQNRENAVMLRSLKEIDRIVQRIKLKVELGCESGQIDLVHITPDTSCKFEENEIAMPSDDTQFTQDVINIIEGKFEEWGYEVESEYLKRSVSTSAGTTEKLVLVTSICW